MWKQSMLLHRGIQQFTSRICHARRTFSIHMGAASRVVVALSGGVDSSVVAALLQQQVNQTQTQSTMSTTELSAIHMSNWNVNDDDSIESKVCTSQADYNDALKVAQHLALPLRRVSFEAEYWTQVFEPYMEEILAGKMGNPDLACNTHIKFGALLNHLRDVYKTETFLLATGHYARLWKRSMDSQAITGLKYGHLSYLPNDVHEALDASPDLIDWLSRWGVTNMSAPALLLSGRDSTKDQSYFLAACSGWSLANVIFPLGDLYKNQCQEPLSEPGMTVRELAGQFHLPTAAKRESMGICFIGKRKNGFRDFCSQYLPQPTNRLDFFDVDTEEIIGRTSKPAHAVLYTIGQGARVGGSPQKYFVVERKLSDHQIWVCAGTHHPALYADSLELDASTLNWIAGIQPTPLQSSGEMRIQCRIRHLQPLVDATIVQKRDANTMEILFDKPIRGITPGQIAAFYIADGLLCLGSGMIAKAGPSYMSQSRTLPSITQLHPSGHNDDSLQGRGFASADS